MPTEFFNNNDILTFAGCALATGVITQMFKKIGFFLKVPTQLISYIVALTILIFGNLAIGAFNFSNLFLMLVNAAVIALATNGGYDAARAVIEVGEKNEIKALESQTMNDLEAPEALEEEENV